jgi:hypothetical protein
MAMTLSELRELVDRDRLTYFVDPAQPRLVVPMTGLFGAYQFLVMLEVEGQFLQLRTFGLVMCPPGHPHLDLLCRTIAQINVRSRLVKVGWDPTSGEIVAFADLWLMDNRLTHAQWTRMFQNFTPVADLTAHRLRELLEHGVDPGELDLHSAVQVARSRETGGVQRQEDRPAPDSSGGTADEAAPPAPPPADDGPSEI